MIEEKKVAEIKWYYKPVWIVVAILAVGPLALPLVWLSPRLNKLLKVIVTILIIIATIWMVKTTAIIYKDVMKQVSELQDALR